MAYRFIIWTLAILMLLQISAVKANDNIKVHQHSKSESSVDVGVNLARSGNYERAAILWEKAAEDGNPEAQILLASAYADGKGVTKNYQKAFYWYLQAAEQGYELGQYYVASCYNAGKGVATNPKEAFRWYHLAAEKGNKESQYNVGAAYYNGIGVDKDKIQAYAWIYASSQNGFDFAAKYLEEVEKKLAPSELNKAQELAREILNKNFIGNKP